MNTTAFPSGTTLNQARCIDVLARAFATDPAARWIYPDDMDYWLNFPAFIRAFAGKAFLCDTAYPTPLGEGVAMWLPPFAKVDEIAIATIIDATLPEDKAEEAFAFMAEMDRLHPKGPHWYLPMIGVDPTRQGRGVGSELMQRALANCDREGMPAYLEATTEANRRFYERFGYEVIGTIQAGTSPTMYAMRREPKR